MCALAGRGPGAGRAGPLHGLPSRFPPPRPSAHAAGDAGPGPRHRPPGRIEVCLYGQYQRPPSADHLLSGLRRGVDRAGRLPSGSLRPGSGPLPALPHGGCRAFRRGPWRLGRPPDAGPYFRLRQSLWCGRPACPSSRDGCTTSSRDGCTTSSRDGCTTSSRDGCTTSSRDGCTTSSRDGCTTSSRDGCTTSSRDGCTTSSRDGCTTSSRDGCTTSSRDGCTTSSRDGCTTSSRDGCTSQAAGTAAPQAAGTAAPQAAGTAAPQAAGTAAPQAAGTAAPRERGIIAPAPKYVRLSSLTEQMGQAGKPDVQGENIVPDQPQPTSPAVNVASGKPKLSKPQEQLVLQAACRRVIAAVVGSPPERLDQTLEEIAAVPLLGAFVTLKRSGQLRSCCGFLGQSVPLAQAIDHAAFRAATDDPRFPPISPVELPDLDVDVLVALGIGAGDRAGPPAPQGGGHRQARAANLAGQRPGTAAAGRGRRASARRRRLFGTGLPQGRAAAARLAGRRHGADDLRGLCRRRSAEELPDGRRSASGPARAEPGRGGHAGRLLPPQPGGSSRRRYPPLLPADGLRRRRQWAGPLDPIGRQRPADRLQPGLAAAGHALAVDALRADQGCRRRVANGGGRPGGGTNGGGGTDRALGPGHARRDRQGGPVGRRSAAASPAGGPAEPLGPMLRPAGLACRHAGGGDGTLAPAHRRPGGTVQHGRRLHGVEDCGEQPAGPAGRQRDPPGGGRGKLLSGPGRGDRSHARRVVLRRLRSRSPGPGCWCRTPAGSIPAAWPPRSSAA